MKLVEDACITENDEGEGFRNGSRTNRMRRTLANDLFERDHSNFSVALRTGRYDLNSLKSYYYL